MEEGLSDNNLNEDTGEIDDMTTNFEEQQQYDASDDRNHNSDEDGDDESYKSCNNPITPPSPKPLSSSAFRRQRHLCTNQFEDNDTLDIDRDDHSKTGHRSEQERETEENVTHFPRPTCPPPEISDDSADTFSGQSSADELYYSEMDNDNDDIGDNIDDDDDHHSGISDPGGGGGEGGGREEDDQEEDENGHSSPNPGEIEISFQRELLDYLSSFFNVESRFRLRGEHQRMTGAGSGLGSGSVSINLSNDQLTEYGRLRVKVDQELKVLGVGNSRELASSEQNISRNLYFLLAARERGDWTSCRRYCRYMPMWSFDKRELQSMTAPPVTEAVGDDQSTNRIQQQLMKTMVEETTTSSTVAYISRHSNESSITMVEEKEKVEGDDDIKMSLLQNIEVKEENVKFESDTVIREEQESLKEQKLNQKRLIFINTEPVEYLSDKEKRKRVQMKTSLEVTDKEEGIGSNNTLEDGDCRLQRPDWLVMEDDNKDDNHAFLTGKKITEDEEERNENSCSLGRRQRGNEELKETYEKYRQKSKSSSPSHSTSPTSCVPCHSRIHQYQTLTIPITATGTKEVITHERVHRNGDWDIKSAIYGSRWAVRRLGMETRFMAHEGCINALDFSATGAWIVSGSDDRHLVITDWQQRRQVSRFTVGHSSNIFQVRFLPASNDLELVSCSRDASVRYAALCSTGQLQYSRLLTRHKDCCHKLDVPIDQSCLVISAGEDSRVIGSDVRAPTKSGGEICVVDKVPLYTISCSPVRSQEFAVAGKDSRVFIYDRRRASIALNDLCPENLSTKPRGSYHVTSVVYSRNGESVLASYNDDDIYLLSTWHRPDEPVSLHRYHGHRNVQTVTGVSFYGPQHEYVVSGSNDGHVFIWERYTEALVNWFRADENGVVNVLEPHPSMPILATAGLDHDFKIWSMLAADGMAERGLPLDLPLLERDAETSRIDYAWKKLDEQKEVERELEKPQVQPEDISCENVPFNLRNLKVITALNWKMRDESYPFSIDNNFDNLILMGRRRRGENQFRGIFISDSDSADSNDSSSEFHDDGAGGFNASASTAGSGHHHSRPTTNNTGAPDTNRPDGCRSS